VKKRKHPTGAHEDPTSRHVVPSRGGRSRGDGWAIATFLGIIFTGTLVVLCLYSAIPAYKAGRFTSITAAQLEGGARPASGWVELGGVALERERVREVVGRRLRYLHPDYVPVMSAAQRGPPIQPSAFLYVAGRHHEHYDWKASSFRGTVSMMSMPSQVRETFERHGVHPAPNAILINFDEEPPELKENAGKFLCGAVTLGLITVGLGLIARGKST
jgi:hypothetical protein